jgi:putative copper export protein
MRFLYLVSVWTHILAATIWVGGLFFLVLVVVPWLRRGRSEIAVTFLTETGERFRFVGWLCFAMLLVTGTFNLAVRGVRIADLRDPGWWTSAFGSAVALKLGLFVLIVTLSAVHDFGVGPRAAEAMAATPEAPRARSLRRTASILGRLNGLLALAMLAVAVILVRGWPG